MSSVTGKFSLIFCAVSAAALLAACDDDDAAPDARIPPVFDADVGDPIDAGIDSGIDAAPDKPVTGTIAVLDVKITNNLGGTVIAGNAVSITYTDPDADEGTVTFGTPGAIGECSVTVYDAALGQTPPPALDDGAVGIAGATTPLITGCTFLANAGSYLCPAAAPAAIPAGTTITAADPTTGVQSIIFPAGATLPTDNVGRGVILGGLANAANNTSPGSTFPIVSNTPANVITIVNKGGVADPDPAATATFFILSGAGPTPAARDFLAADTEVTITKAVGVTPAISQVFTAAGDGLVLADDSIQPEDMPTTDPAADLKVSCLAAENGNCGATGAGGIAGLVVTGRTTNGVIPGGATPPFFMPAPLADGKIATFTCTFTASSGVIPADAWAAVLATNPTRIETRVLRARAVPGGTGGTNLLVGHGLIGYTTIAAP